MPLIIKTEGKPLEMKGNRFNTIATKNKKFDVTIRELKEFSKPRLIFKIENF